MVSQNLPVVSVPLIMFIDDSSGNRSKKWNCFDVWYLLLGGLSIEENAHLRLNHLLHHSHVQIELAHSSLQLILLQINLHFYNKKLI